MRWGDVVGLEVEYVRPADPRVEWQLYQLDTGELVRCPPKDDSHRAIDTLCLLVRRGSGRVAGGLWAGGGGHGAVCIDKRFAGWAAAE